jgi:hypothetical protein
MATAKKTLWTLDTARTLIGKLQPKLHDIGWHVVLGGGVLNDGESANDLDLYVLPMNIEERNEGAVWGVLEEVLEPAETFKLHGPPYGPANHNAYTLAMKFLRHDGVVDVFVVQS